MGYVLQARCNDCHYESDKLIVGNSRNFISICSSCRSVVNPERIQFLYDLPNCPQCGVKVRESEIVDSLRARVDFEGKQATTYNCPKCHNGTLAFRKILHFRPQVSDRCPDENETVHGTLSKGRLEIPGLYLHCGKVVFENCPETISDKPMELIVVRVEKEEDVVKKCLVRFVKYLEM